MEAHQFQARSRCESREDSADLEISVRHPSGASVDLRMVMASAVSVVHFADVRTEVDGFSEVLEWLDEDLLAGTLPPFLAGRRWVGSGG